MAALGQNQKFSLNSFVLPPKSSEILRLPESPPIPNFRVPPPRQTAHPSPPPELSSLKYDLPNLAPHPTHALRKEFGIIEPPAPPAALQIRLSKISHRDDSVYSPAALDFLASPPQNR